MGLNKIMDYEALRKAINAECKRLYMSRHPEGGGIVDVPDYDQKMRRLSNLRRRVNDAINKIAKINKVNEYRNGLRDKLRFYASKKNTATFLSFDIERKNDKITEIGFTVYKAGSFESYNYRVNGVSRRQDFDFGQTEIIEQKDIANIIKNFCRNADFYVGHSLPTDLSILYNNNIIIPRRDVIDTFVLADAFIDSLGESGNRSLSVMAKKFGVAAPTPHNAGNDSRYSMELILKMFENIDS